jgi:alcohol dehydrogenase class IV
MNPIRIAKTPITHIGWGASENLQESIKQFNAHKILVVADPVLQQIAVLDKILLPLKRNGILFDVYTEITPEPTLQTGQKLVDFTRNGGYDLVVGIGGGSALDLAKVAAVFMKNEGNVKEYLNLTGSKSLINGGCPKILLPTTSGTGAEVTNISVFALENTKDVISNDFLIADVAIIDPKLTITLPAKVTAATGADALTHAIEAYISVNANPYSDGLALQAISLISNALKTAVLDGNNEAARTDMSYASYLAGLSFFNAGVGAIHAMAYPLGGYYHIPHGDSNAVLIPYVLDYIQHSCHPKIAKIYKAMGGYVTGLSLEEVSEKCISNIKSLLNEVGIPQTLKGFNIPLSALDTLADDAIKQKRLLSRCPMELDRNDIFNIYQASFNG